MKLPEKNALSLFVIALDKGSTDLSLQILQNICPVLVLFVFPRVFYRLSETLYLARI